jgi:hypothetical protein
LIPAGLACLALIALAAVGVLRLLGGAPPSSTSSESPGGTHRPSTGGTPTGPPSPQPGLRVTDNSGDLSAVVPQAWGDVVGNGWHPQDPPYNGSYIGPGFNATPNLTHWFNDLVTPGIFVGVSKLLITEHYNPVTTLGAFAPLCDFSSRAPIAADGLTGYRDVWTCQGSTTRYETMALWPKDHSFIAFIELKIVTPVDEADGNRVLATLSIRY